MIYWKHEAGAEKSYRRQGSEGTARTARRGRFGPGAGSDKDKRIAELAARAEFAEQMAVW